MWQQNIREVKPKRIMIFCIAIMVCVVGVNSNGKNISFPVKVFKDGNMKELFIDLQSGFNNDSVVVTINGKKFINEGNISTKLLTGLCESFKTKVNPGQINIHIQVPTKGIEKTLSIEMKTDTYLGFSIENNGIQYIVSDKPFGYG